MFSLKNVLSLALTATMLLGTASCSLTAPSVNETQSITETTVTPFTPVELTNDYKGPILGIKNWHIENLPYVQLFINDDTGEDFASCTNKEKIYLADLNNDGMPELVCVEKFGPKSSTYCTVFKSDNGEISLAMPNEGGTILGPYYYPEFAKAKGITINSSNYNNYSDRFDPDRNMIIVTDSSTGTEYEFLWEYFVFFNRKEFAATVAKKTGQEDDTASKAAIDGKIEYKTSKPSITDVSSTEKKVVFYRDGNELEGKLYLPKGKGPFQVIILACGLHQPYTDYEDKAKVFAANGYAAVVFSFYGNTEGNAMTDGATMLSQVKDLYAVMDSLGSLPGVNKDKVYLWGHSFGGRVAAYVASRRISEIKGLLLAEPTINTDEHVVMQDSPEISVNIFNMLKKIEVHTVIYIGTHDGFGENPGAFDKVLNTIPSGRLVTIDGSDHFFNGAYGQKMVEDACKQMNSWNS